MVVKLKNINKNLKELKLSMSISIPLLNILQEAEIHFYTYLCGSGILIALAHALIALAFLNCADCSEFPTQFLITAQRQHTLGLVCCVLQVCDIINGLRDRDHIDLRNTRNMTRVRPTNRDKIMKLNKYLSGYENFHR